MRRLFSAAATFAVAVGAAVLALAPSANAQDWPNRKVDILVPTAAGGNTDLMARLAAEFLQKKLGQPFVVQNKPSAGGVLTSQQVATSDPDGYTVLFAPNSMILLTPLVQPVPMDFDAALAPVTNVGTGSQVLVVRAGIPAKSLAELIDYARANPGKLNVAYAGANNISHLGPILLFKKAGAEVTMVPTRGEPQAVIDLLSGSVDVYFGNASVLLATDREKIRLLAVGTANRLPNVPDLPAISEMMPGFVFASWNGFLVPAKTPEDVRTKLRSALAEFVQNPEIAKKLSDLGIVPGGQSADQVAATFKSDRESFAAAVAAAGVKKP